MKKLLLGLLAFGCYLNANIDSSSVISTATSVATSAIEATAGTNSGAPIVQSISQLADLALNLAQQVTGDNPIELANSQNLPFQVEIKSYMLGVLMSYQQFVNKILPARDMINRLKELTDTFKDRINQLETGANSLGQTVANSSNEISGLKNLLEQNTLIGAFLATMRVCIQYAKLAGNSFSNMLNGAGYTSLKRFFDSPKSIQDVAGKLVLVVLIEMLYRALRAINQENTKDKSTKTKKSTFNRFVVSPILSPFVYSLNLARKVLPAVMLLQLISPAYSVILNKLDAFYSQK